jgi:hypothetical protein
MPIEIKEIVIKATISDGPAQSGNSNGTGNLGEEDKNEIISKAVEKVMQILEDKKNR